MAWPTCDLFHRHAFTFIILLGDESLKQNRWILLLYIWIFNAELPLCVRAHRVYQMLACYEYGMARSACDLYDRYIVWAEPWDAMDLSCATDLIAQPELAEPVGAPREDLGEIRFSATLLLRRSSVLDMTMATLAVQSITLLLFAWLLCAIEGGTARALEGKFSFIIIGRSCFHHF